MSLVPIDERYRGKKSPSVLQVNVIAGASPDSRRFVSSNRTVNVKRRSTAVNESSPIDSNSDRWKRSRENQRLEKKRNIGRLGPCAEEG